MNSVLGSQIWIEIKSLREINDGKLYCAKESIKQLPSCKHFRRKTGGFPSVTSEINTENEFTSDMVCSIHNNIRL